MKILIVSGFLGAGKTTFIKEMVKRVSKDFVVMENEYGEVGVDKALLEDEKEINIWELTEGCICCTMKSDFASSILTIANTLDPEYLVVEPTGVGSLSNVVQNIKQIAYERISLLSPVTILDANCYSRYMREYGDIFDDQLAAAGKILISKGDFAAEGGLEELARRIKKRHPKAEVLTRHYTAMEPDWWESLLHTDLEGNRIRAEAIEEAELESLGLKEISLPGANHLIDFLERLIRGEFGRICRAKGFVDVGNSWLRFDVVDDRYSVCGFAEAERGKSVFIGNQIERNKLRKLLTKNSQKRIKIQKRGAAQGERKPSD